MNVIKLGMVTGAKDFANEVFALKGSSTKEKKYNTFEIKNITVFFGGDVQDLILDQNIWMLGQNRMMYRMDEGDNPRIIRLANQTDPEVMASHRDNGQYLRWNLLNMVTLLSQKFPSNSILVIKPARMELRTFSCYTNFVTSDKFGVPTYEERGNALEHLQKLILNCIKKLSKQSELSNEEVMHCSSDKISKEESYWGLSSDDTTLMKEIQSINIIGFSKGCVVLNQLITEVYSVSTNHKEYENLLKFWSKVCSIYWLDGGHSGGKDTWITRKSILNTLASFPNLTIHVHVSPYQVKDERRPWIGEECKSFVGNLRRAKANIQYELHFGEEVPSLENHFRILEEFKPNFTSTNIF